MRHFIASMPYCMLISFIFSTSGSAGLVTFEDVGSGLGPDGFDNGGPVTNNNPLISGGVAFENNFTFSDNGTPGNPNDDFSFWDGWAFSNVIDNSTPGFLNQYAAYYEGAPGAGVGADDSRTYAVGFVPSAVDAMGKPLGSSTVTFAGDAQVQSVDVNNTTYAVLALRDGLPGGMFAPEQFQDGDFLRLIIKGHSGVDGSGLETGTIEFDLANYGGAGTGDDFILTDWATVDLTSLGTVRSLSFALENSIIDDFGFARFNNTPNYFAIDNLSAIPEPSSLCLVGVLGTSIMFRRRRWPRT